MSAVGGSPASLCRSLKFSDSLCPRWHSVSPDFQELMLHSMETEELIKLPTSSNSGHGSEHEDPHSQYLNSEIKAESNGEAGTLSKDDDVDMSISSGEENLDLDSTVLKDDLETADSVEVAVKMTSVSHVHSENGSLPFQPEISFSNHMKDETLLSKEEKDSNCILVLVQALIVCLYGSKRGVKRPREPDDEQQPSVRVIYSSLPRESTQKLEELLQQWSKWHSQKCSSLDNSSLESGEKTYFPALRVGLDNPSAIELDPPPWLNRMRELGYPPGYLDVDLEDQPSGITIFGEETNEKEGEILGVGPIEPSKTKAVEFPGINAPIPKNAHEWLWAQNPTNSSNLSEHRSQRRHHNHSPYENLNRNERRWSGVYLDDDGPPGCEPWTSPSLSNHFPRYGDYEYGLSPLLSNHFPRYNDYEYGLSPRASPLISDHFPRYGDYEYGLSPNVSWSSSYGRSWSDRGMRSPPLMHDGPLSHGQYGNFLHNSPW
ncbi:zinc finger CCHC domain-containing protein [Striga asiatica]|uniref:Zinc finger CCHC domain-containing protein n=1 Tax=Striga asiatica TaxID=4170 RepID=A0A5A7PDZ2_STRAF|nr:zinc finger CCHC domain-containing protein [Striga asiatica]